MNDGQETCAIRFPMNSWIIPQSLHGCQARAIYTLATTSIQHNHDRDLPWSPIAMTAFHAV